MRSNEFIFEKKRKKKRHHGSPGFSGYGWVGGGGSSTPGSENGCSGDAGGTAMEGFSTRPLTSIDDPARLNQLQQQVQDLSEKIDSESVNVEGDEYKKLEKDSQALAAVEYVITNNIKALQNPSLRERSIFLYDVDNTRSGLRAIGAIHVFIEESGVANVKWLGSYGSSGRRLLHTALSTAKRAGATKLKITAKWESEGFYQKLGFTEKPGSRTSNPLAGSDFVDFEDDLVESQNNDLHTKLTEFVGFCKEELQLDSAPKITIVRDPAFSVKNKTFGHTDLDEGSITVQVKNRHILDIFRTLAHELVHIKQMRENRLKPGSGKDGSDHENEANSVAGVILRKYAKMHPDLFRRVAETRLTSKKSI